MLHFLQLVSVVTETLEILPKFLLSAASAQSNQPGSDEAGVLEELDEDLVDKLVLGDGLNHQHPLPPQLRQHGGHLHWLRAEGRGAGEGETGGEVNDRK